MLRGTTLFRFPPLKNAPPMSLSFNALSNQRANEE